VGVIGFGKAGRQHADAARRSGEAEVVAIADPALAATQAADELGVRCWPEYDAMLDAVDLDAVVVSLPHAALPAAALAAARHGRHILLEKPMAATSTDARDVVRACREAKVRLMVNFVHRFRAEYRQAHAAMQAGAIGQPVLVLDVIASGRSDLPGWVWDHDTAGGGMMMYNGTHSLDRLAWLTGSPIATVSGAMGTFCYPVADEDSAIATVTFRNGTLGAVIEHKSDAPATLAGWQTTVYGTDGGIQITSGSGLTLTSGKERFTLQMEEDDRFLGAFREFAAAIREERDPTPSGADGLHALLAVEALYEAARTGTTVTIGEVA
ncbi:MAG: Gfo/Idh/MocA family protein, partial [Thermomicrobiales bacterium]